MRCGRLSRFFAPVIFNQPLFCFPDMGVFLAVHLPRLPLEVFGPKWSPEPAYCSAVLEKDKVVVADATASAVFARKFWSPALLIAPPAVADGLFACK